MWDSQKYFKRIDYGVLDWLSDVGGLYKAIYFLFFSFVSFLLYDSADLVVTSELVASSTNLNRNKQGKEVEQDILNRSVMIHASDDVQKNCCLLLRMNMQRWCKCCGFKANQQYKNLMDAEEET